MGAAIGGLIGGGGLSSSSSAASGPATSGVGGGNTAVIVGQPANQTNVGSQLLAGLFPATLGGTLETNPTRFNNHLPPSSFGGRGGIGVPVDITDSQFTKTLLLGAGVLVFGVVVFMGLRRRGGVV